MERFDAAVSRIVPEIYVFDGNEQMRYIDITKSLNVFLVNPGSNTTEWDVGEIYGTSGGMFSIAGVDGKPLATMINKQKPLTIELKKPLKAISFLWATLSPLSIMNAVGLITVNTANDKKTIQILVGKEIMSSSEPLTPRATVHAMLSISKTFNLSQYTLRLPDNAQSITISAETPIILAAISAIE